MGTDVRPALVLGIVLALAPLALAVGLPIPGPRTYRGDSIEAIVVDDATGAPLKGVVVAMYCELVGYHDHPQGIMAVMETETDEKGRFHFDGWGPKVRPVSGRLNSSNPVLLLFKAGYRYKRPVNRMIQKNEGRDIISSEWNKETIRMKLFSGTQAAYASHIAQLDGAYLGFAFRHHDCSWRKIPRMLAALIAEGTRLDETGIPNMVASLAVRDAQVAVDHDRCGSASDLLRGYPR